MMCGTVSEAFQRFVSVSKKTEKEECSRYSYMMLVFFFAGDTLDFFFLGRAIFSLLSMRKDFILLKIKIILLNYISEGVL